MPESRRGTKVEFAEGVSSGFVSAFVERLFGAAEHFLERVSDMAEARTLLVINRVTLRIFLLLLLGLGTLFFLLGSIQIINHILRFPGIGQILIGSIMLVVSGVMLFVLRR